MPGLTPLDQLDKLPKSRRDYLEVFGNQWGSRRFAPEETKLTPEEKRGLEEALNFFKH